MGLIVGGVGQWDNFFSRFNNPGQAQSQPAHYQYGGGSAGPQGNM